MHTLGDAHLYLNHLDQARLQLTRDAAPAADDAHHARQDDIDDFDLGDFELVDYDAAPGHQGTHRRLNASVWEPWRHDECLAERDHDRRRRAQRGHRRRPDHAVAPLGGPEYFKRTTMGHPMVMGRRTFDSMGALPGRRSIVVTRQPTGPRPASRSRTRSARRSRSSADAEQVFVVGGGEVYRQAMPYAARLLVTEVDQSPDGSVTFPQIDPADWTETARDEHPGFAWVTYERRR